MKTLTRTQLRAARKAAKSSLDRAYETGTVVWVNDQPVFVGQNG